MAETGPAFCRVSMPTFTFSRAVSAGNSRMFWNVRATPSRLTTCVFFPMTLTGTAPGRATSRISPSCGRYTPVSELNSDVLPAPFGPMTARTSPRRICRLTSSRLVTPPKRRVMPRTSNTRSSAGACAASAAGVPVMGSDPFPGRDGLQLRFGSDVAARALGVPLTRQPRELGLAAARRDQTLRPEHHHRDQHRADPHDAVLAGDLVPEEVRQPRQRRRAGDGTDERAHPTEDDVGDDEDRVVEDEVLRVEVAHVAGEEDTGETRGRRTDGEREQLDPRGVHAAGLRGDLVLADGGPGTTQPGALQPIEGHEDDHEQRQEQVPVLQLVAAPLEVHEPEVDHGVRNGRGSTPRAVGEVPRVVHRGDPDDLTEAEG